jgi:hypothetical protein
MLQREHRIKKKFYREKFLPLHFLRALCLLNGPVSKTDFNAKVFLSQTLDEVTAYKFPATCSFEKLLYVSLDATLIAIRPSNAMSVIMLGAYKAGMSERFKNAVLLQNSCIIYVQLKLIQFVL